MTLNSILKAQPMFAPADAPAAGGGSPAAGASAAPASKPTNAGAVPASAKPAKKAPVDTAAITAFAESFLGDAPTVPPGEDGKPAGDGKPGEGAQPKPAAPAKPKLPAKKKPAPPVPAMTSEQIAAAAAEGTARAMSAQAAAAAKPDKIVAPETAVLSDKEQRRVDVLKHMEKLHGEKYKGVAEKYQSSLVKLKDYAAKWQEEHPGQEFDEAAPEHEDFFTKNDVDWEDDDFNDAVVDIRVKSAVDAEREKLAPKLNELEREQKLRDAMPIIHAEAVKTAARFWRAQGDEFKDLFNPTTGVWDQAKADTIRAKDPVAFDIRMNAARALDVETAELLKLYGVPGQNKALTVFDEKNPAHANLSQFLQIKERELSAKPAEEQIDEQNRSFLPADRYWKLTKAQRESQYWTFSANDIAALRADHLSTVAAKLIAVEDEKFASRAAARGISLDGKSQPPRKPATEEVVDELESADGKPISPSSDAQPKMAAAANAAGKDGGDPVSSFVSRGL